MSAFTYDNITYLYNADYMYNAMIVEVVAILGVKKRRFECLDYTTDGVIYDHRDNLVMEGFDIDVQDKNTLKFIIYTSDFQWKEEALKYLFSHVKPFVRTIPIERLNLSHRGMQNYWMHVSNAIINA